MTTIRLGFYVLYVVLGTIIIVRLLSVGLRWETASGLVLGAALIALGAYRISLYVRMRARQR